MIDVRDLALLHIRAMETPEAAGQRLIAAGQMMWMRDVAQVLRRDLGPAAGRVPVRMLPDWIVRLGARFSAAMRDLRPMLGRRHSFSGQKAKDMLGFVPRSADATVRDCAESLIGRWSPTAA